MDLLEQLLTKKQALRKWISIIITLCIAGIFTFLGIYGMGRYGVALFILIPFFIGIAPSILYGHNIGISSSLAIKLGFITVAIFTLMLFLFAMEGIICIVMAAPLSSLFVWLGAEIGHRLVNSKKNRGAPTLLLLITIIPTSSFIENNNQSDEIAVVTSIEINAPPKVVWSNVIAFPTLNAPEEFLFKIGIAYPISATINGTGVGAIRICKFNTGNFVEPITEWHEPTILKFDVQNQPIPMKELSFWDIDAPHLHDYFMSKKGQFKLTELPNGNTLLEGTTWYTNKIKPTFYWGIWSNYIIHKIHNRVLIHIKNCSEKTYKVCG